MGWSPPPNALYGVQEKGYIDTELFLKWLLHFVKHAPEEKPLILIMDQHETHISKDIIMFFRENLIKTLRLPAHTTHIPQPLDIAVFSPLNGFQDGSGERGSCGGEEAVFTSQTCVSHCCQLPKYQGWVPQGRHLSSVQGGCGHNSGNVNINIMIIYSLNYLHFF